MEGSHAIEASEALWIVLGQGTYGKERAQALEDLAEFYPEELSRALVRRLFCQDPDLDVRLTAAYLLATLKTQAPMDDLLAAFQNAAEPSGLRVLLAELLGHLGTQAELEALEAAMHDP